MCVEVLVQSLWKRVLLLGLLGDRIDGAMYTVGIIHHLMDVVFEAVEVLERDQWEKEEGEEGGWKEIKVIEMRKKKLW
jgi:hypothetical protein